MPILKILGINDLASSFVWLGSPLLGLVVGPIIGQLSDRCTCRFGRRRPFLVAFGSIACLGIAIVYTAFTFAAEKYALLLAIVGTQLMDWGLDSLAAPAYAYTLDCITNPQAQSRAIYIRTILCGIGGCTGYAISGILGISHFIVLGTLTVFIFMGSLMLTLFSLKETIYAPPVNVNRMSIWTSIRLFVEMIRSTPQKLITLCICDFCNWASFCAFVAYLTSIYYIQSILYYKHPYRILSSTTNPLLTQYRITSYCSWIKTIMKYFRVVLLSVFSRNTYSNA